MEYGNAFIYRWPNGYSWYTQMMDELREPHAILIDGCWSWRGERINNVRDGFKMKNKNNSSFLDGFTQVHHKGNKISYFDKIGNVKYVKKV